MADITDDAAIPEITGLAAGDLIYVGDDPGGTPADAKIAVGTYTFNDNVRRLHGSGSDASMLWDGSDFIINPTYGGGTAADAQLIIQNTFDQVTSTVAIFESVNATRADNDAGQIDFRCTDDAGAQDLVARMAWIATDVSAGASFAGDLVFYASQGGGLLEVFRCDGSARNLVGSQHIIYSGGAGYGLIGESPSAINPTVSPYFTDSNTGLGHGGAGELDRMHFIAGGFPYLSVGNSAAVTNNGQRITIQVATGTHTTNSGTGTETISSAIPAGAIVLGVTTRVTTILAGTGLTTWSIGTSADTDRWGTGLALAAGTTTDGTDFATDVQPTVYPSATDIELNAAAGQFDSGVVRYTIHYYTLTAPTG